MEKDFTDKLNMSLAMGVSVVGVVIVLCLSIYWIVQRAIVYGDPAAIVLSFVLALIAVVSIVVGIVLATVWATSKAQDMSTQRMSEMFKVNALENQSIMQSNQQLMNDQLRGVLTITKAQNEIGKTQISPGVQHQPQQWLEMGNLEIDTLE